MELRNASEKRYIANINIMWFWVLRYAHNDILCIFKTDKAFWPSHDVAVQYHYDTHSQRILFIWSLENILGEIYYMTKFEEIDLVQTLWMNKMGIQLLGAESSKSLESMA